MATKAKISLKHGYTLRFNEDGTFFLRVETEDDIFEFDGTKNGNIIDSSDFCEEDEPYRVTLEESIESTRSWFKDWGIDEDVIEAIIKDLTPWFEKHALSTEKDIERKIARLERIIAFRRNDIEQRMRDINYANERIAKAHKEIEEHTHKVLELNNDIDKYLNTIATLKASLNKSRFVSVEPEYTGGGIYLFTGRLTDGSYFMADTANYDVRVLNADPNEPTGMDALGITERNIDSVEWQEEHLVNDLKPDEAVAFFKEMLKWVEDNDPSGNYLGADMDYFKEELESLHGDWR